MITAYKWHSIARTTTIGASTGIRVEFGESYRILLTTSIDWGNAVISVQNSNLSNTIVASVRLRQNGIHYYLDLKVSQSFSTDFKIELYDNTYWEESSGVSDLAGATLCIIDDINSINTPSPTGGDSFWEEDENGDLRPKRNKDGTARGVYTLSFLSAGGKNANAGEGGGGGITDLLIRFDNISPNPNGYEVVNGVITLPNYPVVPDISNYLTRSQADASYYPLASGNALDSRLSVIEKAFDITIDENGIVQEIKANAGFWTEQFLSSGGKNEDINSGGGISSFIIKLGEDEYALENGVVALPSYPIVPDVSGFILKTTADTLYQPKGNYLTSIPSEYITETELSNALSPYLLSQTAEDTYATIIALNTHIDNYNAHIADYTAFKTNTNKRLQSLEDMFEWDDDGHIKAKAGLYTDSFLSSGGKNTTEGTTGGGLTEFSVIFNGTQYDSSNGVATINGSYATTDDVNTAIANLINGAPSTLDTLKEIADAMDANKDVVDALEEAIGTKASQTDLDALSGRVTTTESGISTNKTAISTLQGYFTNGIAKEAAKVSNIFKIIFNGTTYEYNGSAAKEINFSATNIVSALGTTPVNRAKGDESGNNIKSTYATKTALQDFIDKIEKYFTFGEDNIKANYGLWTDSYLSSGGQNTEGGSGGGGITAFDIMFEGNTVDKYPLENGKVVLPSYPTTLPASDVSAWAKNATLAASDVPNLSWNKITSDKPTTLSGYGITDAISTSGGTISGTIGALVVKRNVANASGIKFENTNSVLGYIGIDDEGVACVWDSALSNKKFFLNSGNYSSYALPLSGGTIRANNAFPLTIKATTASNLLTFIADDSTERTIIGYYASSTRGSEFRNATSGSYIGITDAGTPHYNGNTLIHFGNIGSQSVNYANSAGDSDKLGGQEPSYYVGQHIDVSQVLDANAVTQNHITHGSKWSNVPDSNIHSLLDVTYSADWRSQLLFKPNNQRIYSRFFYNGTTWSSWKTIAFTDSNVASATKLQTARTIWGQSFDGTGDVSGELNSVTRIKLSGGDYGIYRGSNFSSSLATSDMLFHATKHIFNGGNVLIGDSTDAGYKFAVNGSALANTVRTQELRLGEVSPGNDITKNKWYYASIGYEYTDTSPKTLKPDIVFKTMYDTYAEGSGVERMRIKSSGNVLIGDTYDRGAKLQVHSNRNTSNIGQTLLLRTNAYGGSSSTQVINRVQICGSVEGRGSVIDAFVEDAYGRFSALKFGYIDSSVTYIATIDKNGLDVNGNISASGDIEAFSSSDARLKENITTISDDRAIGILSRLNPVTFAWNEIATSLSSRLQGDSQGFIAQEWEKIIPNASGTMWGKYKGIDYIQAIPYLTKGWQIHETKIKRLEREVKELKDKLAKYESII